MQLLLITLALVLVFIVILQVGKAVELISVIKEEDDYREESSQTVGIWFTITGIFLFLFVAITSYTEYGKFLPTPASEQGEWIHSTLMLTLYVTGIVFLVTNFALFFFAWKYRYKKDRKAYFYPDNNKLELLWTVVPALVLTILVGMGIDKWFKIFADAPSEAIVVEATAKQFGWYLRYSGDDNELGVRDFTLVNANNELGVNWNDPASHDDFLSDELVLPVNTPVLVKIGALDVIHNFYLPEFRIMMDAVPGLPTRFWFRPTITTEKMREIKNDPEFDYELACNQLCGTGHWNMKRTVKVVTPEEYKQWHSEQKSFYEQNILAKTEEPAAVVVEETETTQE
ncbi:MAG TPA: cytochrome c oxidase subunit II [Chitinophagales bacterium]|nr:cytochrome c oxidase subunit II [Chitinophagales bacterium]